MASMIGSRESPFSVREYSTLGGIDVYKRQSYACSMEQIKEGMARMKEFLGSL